MYIPKGKKWLYIMCNIRVHVHNYIMYMFVIINMYFACVYKNSKLFSYHTCIILYIIIKEEGALNREKGLLPDVYLTLQSSHKFDTQPNACDTEQCM